MRPQPIDFDDEIRGHMALSVMERIERGEDIEVSQAQVDLEEAKRLLDSSDEAEQRVRHAEARIRAAEKVSGKVS